MKVIFHLDLDSYFVSAERTINKSLIGKPVAVGKEGTRAIVTAASYEAKRRGVKVPMPLHEAKKLIPELIVVEPHFSLYVNLSSKMFDYLAEKYTNKIEIASIDECYIDVTDLVSREVPIKMLARQIQQDIKNKFSLPCSIGVSTNKFVAKMSTQINKPFGITMTKENEFLDVFGDWPIEKYHGIGRGLSPKLVEIGITTIKDLANAKVNEVEKILGKNSSQYIAMANGKGSDAIQITRNDLQSIGNSLTYMDGDKWDLIDIYETLSHLCHLVAARAKNRNFVGYVLRVGIKETGDFSTKTHSKQITLKAPIQEYEDIFKISKNIFQKIWNGESIKFLSVTLDRLEDMYKTTYQSSIFDINKKYTKTEELVKNINKQLKNNKVYLGKEQLNKDNKHRKQSRYIENDRILKHFDKN